jgi:uncharacterized protein
MPDDQRNVIGEPIEICSLSPRTGFYRTGCCETGEEDRGVHTVCVEVTAEFLAFSKASDNALSSPIPDFGFPGLKPGDRWCLCAARWQEALEADAAPRVVLAATHERTLDEAPRARSGLTTAHKTRRSRRCVPFFGCVSSLHVFGLTQSLRRFDTDSLYLPPRRNE